MTARAVATEMMRREGIQAFAKGATARIIMLSPGCVSRFGSGIFVLMFHARAGTALAWAIYEPTKAFLS